MGHFVLSTPSGQVACGQADRHNCGLGKFTQIVRIPRGGGFWQCQLNYPFRSLSSPL